MQWTLRIFRFRLTARGNQQWLTAFGLTVSPAGVSGALRPILTQCVASGAMVRRQDMAGTATFVSKWTLTRRRTSRSPCQTIASLSSFESLCHSVGNIEEGDV